MGVRRKWFEGWGRRFLLSHQMTTAHPSANNESGRTARSTWPVILVAALGYFVDIYDLLLFGIVRVASLRDLGVPEEQLLKTGMLLINWQMAGMLLGGIFWGVLGDRRGRLSVLFGSIFTYSLANVGNGFVQSVELYAALRFIAGLGLAGELGAGITLVSELLSREKRGYGTMIVASVGILGAVVASLVADSFHWRISYFIGGGLGLTLLLLRVGAYESGMYGRLAGHSTVKRGNFLALFQNRSRFVRYLRCIVIGLPTWFTVGILVTFAPEFGRTLHITEPLSAGRAIMFTYIGLAIGDITSGTLSQYFRTRKLVVGYSLAASLILYIVYLFLSSGRSAEYFYGLCIALGLANGYWAVFVTIAAEQFGTNLRATVATTVPNFVRGALVPLTLIFQSLSERLGTVEGAMLVGGASIALAFIALLGMEETHGKDLDYLELP